MTKEYQKVSVITVIKDLVKSGRIDSFKECVDSIRRQTYPNIEHLVIDGASTDGTIDLLKKLKCHYVSLVDHGIYEAMNTGIRKSTGEYVIFINSDDKFYTSEAISLLVKKIQEEKGDYVYAISRMMKNNKLEWLFDDHLYEFWNRMPFNHQTMLCRKELFNKMGYFDERYKFAADYKFILTCILNDAKGCYLPKCVVNFAIDNRTLEKEKITYDEQATIYMEMYENFYKFKSQEEAINLICARKVSPKFLRSFKAFLISRKLKNMNLKQVIDVVNRLLNSGTKICILGILRFKFLRNDNDFSLLLFNITIFNKIVRPNKTKYYLFGCIPLLKIKRYVG